MREAWCTCIAPVPRTLTRYFKKLSAPRLLWLRPTATRSSSNLEEKRSGPPAAPDLLRRNLIDPIYVQLGLGQQLSLPLLAGRGYLYPKKFGNRLLAREGEQPVSTVLFLYQFTWEFVCSCLWGKIQDSCLRCCGGKQGRLSPGRTDPPSRPTPPRPAAVRRPAPNRPWYVRVLDSTGSVYIGFPLFLLPKKRSGCLFSVPWKSKWTVVPWAHHPASVPPRFASPLRPAPTPRHAAPCPASGMPGFWIRQVQPTAWTSVRPTTARPPRPTCKLQTTTILDVFCGSTTGLNH